jgi:DNA-binding MarR family transcriptional regulator
MSIKTDQAKTAAGGPAGADLEAFLLGVLRLASVLNDSVIFARHGIGLAEWAVLRDIGAERIPLSQLWRRTRLSRQRVRVLVKELERKGLVEVAMDGDGRRRTLAATPDAIQHLRAITEALNALDLPGKGRGLPRAARFAHQLLRTLRQTKKKKPKLRSAAHLESERLNVEADSRPH